MNKKPHHILIVEDDDLMRDELSHAFSENGYAVSSAETGEEAIKIALNKKPELIVLDVLMPHMTAWEQSIWRDLLTTEGKRRFYAKHIIEGLLRGSPADRAEYYNKMFALGAYSTNDILEIEDRNPVEGGDQRFVPLNMISLENAGKVPEPAKNSRMDQLIESEATRVARKEVEAVGKAIKRGLDGFEKWARDFYTKHALFVAQVLVIDEENARHYTDHALSELLEIVKNGDIDAINNWSETRIHFIKQVAYGN